MNTIKRFSLDTFQKKHSFYFSLEEKVVVGKMKSRLIGFPTINFNCQKQKFLPFNGCYVTYLKINLKYYFGLTCIKKNFNKQVFCYTYIDKFSGNLYQKKVKIHFIFFYRHNIKFTTWQKMREILEKDFKILSSKIVIDKNMLKLSV